MKTFFKNNWFMLTMVLGMLAGAITGWIWPGATALEPLGTIFINMMFCVVVPMVFFSISSAVSDLKLDKLFRRRRMLDGYFLCLFRLTQRAIPSSSLFVAPERRRAYFSANSS